ncbi:MAG: SDR family NAD(P)-dependent oxidoreductase, partial [Bacteroidales bacterium]|nr:SDR family NAD(P)-dependent oxidoreductase [Bacteroidales bacterium]
MINLENKVAIVTGGSKGIGKAIAQLFHELGAEVNVLDIDEISGRKTVSEISASSRRVTFHLCDVADHQAVGKVFESVFD